jgi:DNA-binding CsgD family transcriptional regulator
MDRGIRNRQIASQRKPHKGQAFHDACRWAADLVATERNKSMRPAPKLDTLMPATEAPGSEERDLPSFADNLPSWWDAGHTKPSSRARDTLTPREREILAMIGQGFSNKRIARTLEISPETVKWHVKRIFLKLTVSTRTEAVLVDIWRRLQLPFTRGLAVETSFAKQHSHPSQGKVVQEVDDGM